MEKEHVIQLRDKLKGQNPTGDLEIWCDNSIFYIDSNRDDYGDIVDWDDEMGVLRVIKTTENTHHNEMNEFIVTCVDYEIIQYLNMDCSRHGTERIAKDLGFSAANIEKLKKFVKRATTIYL